jgi:hypothetical protein
MLTELTIQSTAASFPTADARTADGRARHACRPIALAGSQTSFARNAQIYREKEPAAHLYKLTTGRCARADGRRHQAFTCPATCSDWSRVTVTCIRGGRRRRGGIGHQPQRGDLVLILG